MCIRDRLAAGHTLPSTIVEFDDLLELVETSGELANAIDFWRCQQLWERLLGWSEKDIFSLPNEYLLTLLKQSKVSTIEELIEKKEYYSNFVEERMSALFSDNILDDQQLEEWLETKVHWA